MALALLIASHCSGAAQELPQQMGAINDYAVALGGKAQREPLEALVNQLNQEHQVSLIILLSERDPYSDLERYGIEVQRAWSLPQQRQVFGLFFKGERRWYFQPWVSADLESRFGSEALGRLREQVEQLTQRNHIQEATERLAAGLFQLLTQADAPLAQPSQGNPWVFVATIFLPCLLVMWLFVRWARSFCPRCVKPLHRSRTGGKTLLYCPNCGYNR